MTEQNENGRPDVSRFDRYMLSQLLTLFITPVLLTYMEDLAGALRRLFRRRTRSVGGAAA